MAVATRRENRDRSGRTERRRSQTASARDPDLSKFYARTLPDVVPGEFRFRLEIPKGGPNGGTLVLDRFVERFGWSEENAEVTATMTLRRPEPDDTASIPLSRGTLIRCRVQWQGRWFELWTMRCERPDVAVETGQISVDLVDDMAIVRRGRRRYVYRTTRRRRHGWFGHDALRHAAKKDGIKLGRIAKCSRRMDKIVVTGSFLDLAVKIYTNERDDSGRKFVLRMNDGRFEVVPYERNRILYRLARQLGSAIVSRTPVVDNPFTVLTGRARVGKGRRTRRIVFTKYDRDVVRQLGYSHKVKNYGRVASAARLRSAVTRDLARQYRVDTTVRVTTPGIPFLRLGDGAMIVIPSEGFEDDRAFVYLTAVRHTVEGSSYTTEVEANYHDPFTADRKRREKEARERKRRDRSSPDLGEGWVTVGASVFNDAVGYRNNESLAGKRAFAELGMGTFLGGLAYRTEADFEYKGTIVRGIKLDIGDGGDPVDGYRRDVDLHNDLAAALGAPLDDVFLIRMRLV